MLFPSFCLANDSSKNGSQPSPLWRRFCIAVVLLCFQLGIIAGENNLLRGQEKDDSKSSSFGFEPVEIYKLSKRAEQVTVADFNGDQLKDILIVRNEQSRVDIFLQRKDRKTEPVGWMKNKTEDASSEKPVNELTDSWRYRRVEIPVEHNIIGITTGDFNKDGRIDFCYSASPNRVVFRYQTKAGQFQPAATFRIPGKFVTNEGIKSADLNADKQDEVILVAAKAIYVLGAAANSSQMEVLQKIIKTQSTINQIAIQDFNNDNILDLAYFQLTSNETHPIGIRQGIGNRQFGAEFRFRTSVPRGISLLRILNLNTGTINTGTKTGKAAAITIDQRSSRINHFQFQFPKREAEKQHGTKQRESKRQEMPLVGSQYGTGSASGSSTFFTQGDFNGDQLEDIIVADPKKAQVILFRQDKKNGITSSVSSPCFLGVEQIASGKMTRHKNSQIAVLSQKENRIGISTFKNGRFTFPQIVTANPIQTIDDKDFKEVKNKPLVLTMCDVNTTGQDNLVAIYSHESKKYRSSSSRYVLHVFETTSASDGDSSVREIHQQSLNSLANNPKGLVPLDANDDHKIDLLVTYTAGREPVLLLGDGKGAFAEIASNEGGVQLTGIDADRVFVSPTDPAEIFIAQGAFARQVRLDSQNRWQVIEQFNPTEPNAKITGVFTMPLDDKKGNEVGLLDSANQKLHLFRKEARQDAQGVKKQGHYQSWKTIEIGSGKFKKPLVADFNADNKKDVFLQSNEQFSIFYHDKKEPQFHLIDSYSPRLKKAYWEHVATGDLNSDNRTDVVLVDTTSHRVEILEVSSKGTLQHATRWRVFEEKSFSNDSSSGDDPREIIIDDVTGDGANDIILLVHDRLLVYPQQRKASTQN